MFDLLFSFDKCLVYCMCLANGPFPLLQKHMSYVILAVEKLVDTDLNDVLIYLIINLRFLAIPTMYHTS